MDGRRKRRRREGESWLNRSASRLLPPQKFLPDRSGELTGSLLLSQTSTTAVRHAVLLLLLLWSAHHLRSNSYRGRRPSELERRSNLLLSVHLLLLLLLSRRRSLLYRRSSGCGCEGEWRSGRRSDGRRRWFRLWLLLRWRTNAHSHENGSRDLSTKRTELGEVIPEIRGREDGKRGRMEGRRWWKLGSKRAWEGFLSSRSQPRPEPVSPLSILRALPLHVMCFLVWNRY